MSVYRQSYSDREIDTLVRGYSDDRLRENFQRASEQPGTVWHVILFAEMRRRGLTAREEARP